MALPGTKGGGLGGLLGAKKQEQSQSKPEEQKANGPGLSLGGLKAQGPAGDESKQEKRANKLISNLGLLSGFGEQLKERFAESETALEAKKQKQEDKKHQSNQALESKIALIETTSKSLRLDIEMKSAELKRIQEVIVKLKLEIEEIKASQSNALNELQVASNAKIKEKQAIIKELQDKMAEIKELIRIERAKRRDLEDNNFDLEEMKQKLNMKQNELNDKSGDKDKQTVVKKKELKAMDEEIGNLEKKLADMEDQKKKLLEQLNQLKAELNQQLAEKDNLQTQIALGPKNLEELELKKDRVLAEIQKLQKDIDGLQKQKGALESEVQAEEARIQDLKNIQAIIKQQWVFERLSRSLYLVVIDFEEQLRRLDFKAKDLLRLIKILVTESRGIAQDRLQEKMVALFASIQKIVQEKNNIKDDMGIINSKILGKNWRDLKLDSVNVSFEKMQSYQAKVDTLSKSLASLNTEYQAAHQAYVQAELSIKEKFKGGNMSQSEGNKALIIEIGKVQKQKLGDLDAVEKKLNMQVIENDGQMAIMEKIRAKIAQSMIIYFSVGNKMRMETMYSDQYTEQIQKMQKSTNNEQLVMNFVTLNVNLSEQAKRLKHVQEEELLAMKGLLDEINKLLKDFEDQAIADKVDDCDKIIADAEKDLDDIDKVIKALQDRLNADTLELAKLDSPDDVIVKNEIQKQLENIQKQLDTQKKEKENLAQKVDKLKKLPKDELAHQHKQLDDIKAQVGQMKNNTLPMIDDDLYDAEEKMKKAIGRKRSAQKRQCYDSIDGNKLNLEKLQGYLEKIEQHIKQLEKEGQTVANLFGYKDLEREDEVESKVRKDLKESRVHYQDLKEAKDQLTKAIADLEKSIELERGSGESSNKDEVVQMWAKFYSQSEEIAKKVKDELGKAQQETEHLDAIGTVVAELQDKYKFKDQKHKECVENQRGKQLKLDKLKIDVENLVRQQQEVHDNLAMIVDCPEISSEFQEKQRLAQGLKDKTEAGKQRQKELGEKLGKICEDLPRLGLKMITTKDLQQILDDLARLDIDFQFEFDDYHNNQVECEKLIEATRDLLEKNKQAKLEEAEKQLRDMNLNINSIDEKYAEVAEKLQEYFDKIQAGLREFQGDEEVQNDLKQLRSEAEKIEKELKQIDRQRNHMRAQEKQMKDQVMQAKAGRSKLTAKDLDKIVENAKEVNSEATGLNENLQEKSDDLDKRILDLEKYMAKHGELSGLHKEFLNAYDEASNHLNDLTKKLDEISDLSLLLKQVLEEMENGILNDYKLKGGFIKTEQEILADVEDQLFKLDETRQAIAVQLQILKQDKLQKNISIQTQDPEQLQSIISEVMEISEKLDHSNKSSQAQWKRLLNIRSDIGIADIPELIQIREKEVTEFSAKLRQLETDFAELKKYLAQSGSTVSKEVQQEVINIDKAIKGYRDDKVSFQRILGQDLQIFLPQPQKLEDLATLKVVIFKVRDLGERTNKSLDSIDEYQRLTVRVRRQVGGIDMMKRALELEIKENDQRERLEMVRKRFEIIGKGAADCDGYTSNTEEATFIDTLLSELPEMKQKQKDSVDECDHISNAIYELKRDIDKQSKSETGELNVKLILENLDQIETSTELNEKTVCFLEKLASKLEDHFLSMDVKRKLDKRQLELQELKNIGEDFSEKLLDMQEHLISDIEKIRAKAKIDNPLQGMLVDETGKPVNLLEEMMVVQDELQEILSNVTHLQERNEDIRARRDQTQEEFNEQILRNSPYMYAGQRITNKNDVFTLLRANGLMKKKIIELIKQLKEISKRMRDSKSRYQFVRNKLESQAPRKLYKAVKGDIVDELFAEYINKLNCPVPIKRLGNNYYTFGTKKIFAKIINGKLVIRVGGGYMGIEEFMMYYGHQELQKIQKEEQMKSDVVVGDLTDQIVMSGSTLLGDDFMSDHEDEEGGLSFRKSAVGQVDIDQLKEKLKQESEKKKKGVLRNSSIGKIAAVAAPADEKATVVGIGDVRKALKKNVISISTYEETKSGGAARMKGNVTVTSESCKVERELRKIEQRIGNKLKANMESRASPRLGTAGSYTSPKPVRKGKEEHVMETKKPATAGAAVSRVVHPKK